MPKPALYRLIAALLLFVTLLGNRLLPRLPITTLRVAPIATLPRALGDWHSVADLPIEEKVHVAIPNAVWLSRLYRDGSGHEAQLLLQTSNDAQMFHSPTVCMPAQNWNIVRTETVPVRSGTSVVNATEMRMEAGDQRALLLYWYTSERQLDKWQALKDKILAGRAPTRMFVRVLVADASSFDAASQNATRFAAATLPAIETLEKQAAVPAPSTLPPLPVPAK